MNGNEKPLIQRVHGAPKKNRKSNRYKTGSFWLNNNNLRNVNGLKNLTDRLLEMSDYLSWLDLSDNNLNVISDVSTYTLKSYYTGQYEFNVRRESKLNVLPTEYPPSQNNKQQRFYNKLLQAEFYRYFHTLIDK